MPYEMKYAIVIQITAAWRIDFKKEWYYLSFMTEIHMPRIIRLMPVGACTLCHIYSLYTS